MSERKGQGDADRDTEDTITLLCPDSSNICRLQPPAAALFGCLGGGFPVLQPSDFVRPWRTPTRKQSCCRLPPTPRCTATESFAMLTSNPDLPAVRYRIPDQCRHCPVSHHSLATQRLDQSCRINRQKGIHPPLSRLGWRCHRNTSNNFYLLGSLMWKPISVLPFVVLCVVSWEYINITF